MHRRLLTSTLSKYSHIINRAYSLSSSTTLSASQLDTLNDRLREEAAGSNVPELTFQDMVEYSRQIQLFDARPQTQKHHKQHLMDAAEFVRKQLCVIIARIVIDIQNLPYGVANNPHIEAIMQTYIDSFMAIKQMSGAKTSADNAAFQAISEQYLWSWTQVVMVPTLCLGLLEMAQQRSLKQIEECPYLSNFIDRIIARRFAGRMLLGHFMALHQGPWGILEAHCPVMSHIEAAKTDAIAIANKIYNLDGETLALPTINVLDKRRFEPHTTDREFVFCRNMIHQFVFELLKNSIRATMEFHHHDDAQHQSIDVVVVNSRDGDITIKVSDSGGGIARNEMERIWLYSYTARRRSKRSRALHTYDEHMDDELVVNARSLYQMELLKKQSAIDKISVTENPYYIGAVLHENALMYGLGYGLPLVNAYSGYFGGSCKLHSIDGYGTDAYLFLPSLNRSQSNLLSMH
eukprot:CAMPEP_0202686470 /NCGR_PEP_ID=MMETSP1385-20130828/2241_1 /ASSEMBLY_ACC=CAM_ASM_000861 /TAXON_ID=933848 /ORGANISM="Elphidium margaritaceum" /LENGTH=461 /DNA_ID=CAMNT_0049341053 /DNA_START=117 /DNA_END=1502 /DNA_ORIENTATION=+